MSGLSSLRRLVTAGLLVACVSATTALAQPLPGTAGPAPAVPAAGGAAATMPATATAPNITGPAMPVPGTMPDINAPIATINGKDINTRTFMEIMERMDGMRVFSMVLDLSLAQSACQGAGIEMTGDGFKKRLDDEVDHTMDDLNISHTDNGKDDGKVLTREQRLNILGAVLQQQGKSLTEFRLWLETRADLRALAEHSVSVEPAEIEDAYKSEYGPKRKIHIMTWPTEGPNAAKVTDIKAALGQNRADGKKMTPEDVAAVMHLPAPAVWTISENAKDGPNAKNIEQIYNIAFTKLSSPGAVSAETDVPTSDGKMQPVIIILDEVIADSMGAHPRDKVSDSLKAKILNVKENQWMDKHLADLRNQASIDIKDPVLADEFEARRKALAAAQAAAASQAATATAPVTMPAMPAAPK